MLNYNNYDIEWINLYNQILEELDEKLVTDEEVWEKAREEKDIPIFENILYELTLNKIKNKLEELFPGIKVSFYINGRDTHLYINDKSINSIQDYEEVIEEINKEIENEINLDY